MQQDNRHRNDLVRGMSRRRMLRQTACGFGGLALAGLLNEDQASAAKVSGLAPKAPHFAPKAKRVIFIFMQGGPSHVDSFDYKDELVKNDGKNIDFVGVRFGTFGKKSKRRLMKPLWRFKKYGQAGQTVSELFPHIAQHVDDICLLKGMHTNGVAHGPSTLFMHTGATALVRPSIGSWVTYGLGSENKNLPAFVTISPSATKGGPRNYSNAFLPTIYQGVPIGRAGLSAKLAKIAHISNPKMELSDQRRQFEFMQKINRVQLEAAQGDDRLDATIKSYELAFRMQMNAPGVLELSGEDEATKEMYGIGEKHSDDFGRQCLMARRLSEAGVRYVQINYGDESPNPRWDQHSNMPAHMNHARATDKPVAGLLTDLKRRGLLEDTLVWWGGEFGRTPFAQGKNGRDHNPRGFSIFLTGGGVKSGFSYGETDEIGHYAVEGKVHMHDLHATILHLMGLDHEKLTYRSAGRDFRLTDVYGEVVKEIMA